MPHGVCVQNYTFVSFRKHIAAATDDRLHVMNEIISGMRIIKMFCWEKPYHSLVKKLRKYVILFTLYDLSFYLLYEKKHTLK